MRILITGSREWTDKGRLSYELWEASHHEDAVIVHCAALAQAAKIPVYAVFSSK